ncbi:uncharacterized protein LOC106173912 [Lingula anatina]|uniref:Uncharacterized protein LOC106173912 n=1 Tax=Lingula anatina TaxID=7574 RepID=A0A1S3JJW0_LINAN|nr:uncharacterized protein LOC106173912 [Lingula anatina]|eukprot:XP_013410700.1 uncharacterized protein LOC106173912 [Lingula anatina]
MGCKESILVTQSQANGTESTTALTGAHAYSQTSLPVENMLANDATETNVCSRSIDTQTESGFFINLPWSLLCSPFPARHPYNQQASTSESGYHSTMVDDISVSGSVYTINLSLYHNDHHHYHGNYIARMDSCQNIQLGDNNELFSNCQLRQNCRNCSNSERPSSLVVYETSV